MKIGLLTDDFTRHCLELEAGVKIVNLTPLNFTAEIIKGLDVILVESAWLGFNALWKKKVADYGSGISTRIWILLKLAKAKGITTIFWNKEDPVSFDRFKHLIEYFDVCLTTESSQISAYKHLISPKSLVGCQPFFFQPRLHNPQADSPVDEKLKDKVIFCGGLYLQEFPDRSRRLLDAVNVIGADNIVVYDRFKSGASSWQSVRDLNVKIETGFDYLDSKYFYQQGKAHLSVTSVDGLKTMFSRRTLELIASGAKVIDLTNNKNKNLLSDFVIQACNKKDVQTALSQAKPNIDFDYLLENYSTKSFIKNMERYLS